ncbi:hypothetical protein [Sinimarinibacterium flocculans]|uniref:hypothetical protein n=1 Tax=Sinimarinibacterium flocculans TaxID=985250 RepID=UPI00249099AD|nr:hypothetical protein [Sinimarinibacterium flocculans]
MDPVLADLIRIISLELITTIGPAVVSAAVAYFVASSQFRSKLKEIRETNEFQARQHLFEYYKRRQKKLSRDYQELSGGISTILGIATATADSENSEALKQMARSYTGFLKMLAGIMPKEVSSTLQEMKDRQLTQTSEYLALAEYQEHDGWCVDFEEGIEGLRAMAFHLMEVSIHLQGCNQRLLENQMNRVFEKYIRSVAK